MLFLHEVHKVCGDREDEFESAFREGWMPLLAKGDDARLLWYTNHAHGSGVSYQVVTVTALRDGAAWERLAFRIQHGDLQDWMRELDELRHDVTGKMLLPLPWSPMREVDLYTMSADGSEHELTLYMEDTMWPYEDKHLEYIEKSGSFYAKTLEEEQAEIKPFIQIEAAFQPSLGTHVRREVSLMQRVLDPEQLLWLLTNEIPREMRASGSWMHEALQLRDQWESKLLRTSSWSPLY